MKHRIIYLLIAHLGVLFSLNAQSLNHQFIESEYVPVYDDMCYREDGILEITNVTDSTIQISIWVSNYRGFTGGVECVALVDGVSYAEFKEVPESNDREAVFEFWASPNNEYIFLEYEGPLDYHGVGICLSGYYKRLPKM